MYKQLNLNSPVFPEKGHREAMLAKICERANANVAAGSFNCNQMIFF
jgi:hypothetical protein